MNAVNSFSSEFIRLVEDQEFRKSKDHKEDEVILVRTQGNKLSLLRLLSIVISTLFI